MSTVDLSTWRKSLLSCCVNGVHFDLSCRIRVREGRSPLDRYVLINDWQRINHWLIGKTGGLVLRVAIEKTASGIELLGELIADGLDKPITLLELEYVIALTDEGPGKVWSVLKQAYCGAYSRSPISRTCVVKLGKEERVRSWWLGAAYLASDTGIVIGPDESSRFVSCVEYESQSLTVRQYLDHSVLEPGKTVSADRVSITVDSGQPDGLLEAYASRFAGQIQLDKIPPPCGWGSWGHWAERIDQSLVREVLLDIDSKEWSREHLSVIQIDDGWSELLESGRVSASWQPNKRFPAGMAPLASEILGHGKECGLWFLPFAVNRGSDLACHRTEWLVKGQDGSPLPIGGGEVYCLDPTHPDAADRLQDICRTLLDWGVTYLKLDFLRVLLCTDPESGSDGLSTKRIYAAGCTRLEAYRIGLNIIRKACGSGVTIVGCSAPILPSHGLLDAHRIGPDIEPSWDGRVSGIRDAAQSVITNYFWHGKAWRTDPDYLIPCKDDYATRFWTTVVCMSGGSVILSTDTREGNEDDIAVFRMACPPIGLAARPVDLFACPGYPSVLHLPIATEYEHWDLLAILNWSDSPRRFEVPISVCGLKEEVLVFDVWNENYLGQMGAIEATLQPREAALFRLSKIMERPQMVGTNLHFSQGAFEVSDESWNDQDKLYRLRFASRLARDGRVWVRVPRDSSDITSVERKRASIYSFAVHPSGEVCVPGSKCLLDAGLEHRRAHYE